MVKYQNTKQGFAIHELRSVFGKIRIELSSSIENCVKWLGEGGAKGYFLYLLLISKIPALSELNIFSFQIVLLAHSNKVRIILPVSTFRAYAWVTTIAILFTEEHYLPFMHNWCILVFTWKRRKWSLKQFFITCKKTRCLDKNHTQQIFTDSPTRKPLIKTQLGGIS